TPDWKPTEFQRFESGLDTSMGTARIITDAGKSYIKAMGNRLGPQAPRLDASRFPQLPVCRSAGLTVPCRSPLATTGSDGLSFQAPYRGSLAPISTARY
ncbi:MAG: hypothetical protein ACKPJJ_03710, partial [Planctomycetaceae bacterium]